jgi:hypothetical protein
MITHVVLFKLNAVSSEKLVEMKALLESMKDNILFLRHLEVGVDLVHSERSHDIALITKFDSLDDLQAYQIHPYHADIVVPYVINGCKSVVTVDYE